MDTTRRTMAILSAALAASTMTATAACDGTSGSQQSAAGGRHLRLLMDLDTSIGTQRRVILQQWNKEHPSMQVDWEELPNSSTRRRSELLARAQAHEQFDVYSLDVPWLMEFAEAHYIKPIPKNRRRELTEGLMPQPLATCQDDEKNLWAVPFNTDVGLLYYNKTLIDEPETSRYTSWNGDQITEALRRLPEGQDPYVGQFVNGEAFTVNTLEALNPKITHIAGGRHKVTIDETDYDHLKQLYGWIGDGAHRNLNQTYDETASLGQFRSGSARFMRNWPSAMRDLLNDPTPDNGKALRFDVTPLPFGGILGGQNLAVASTTKNMNGALDLIKFLTDETRQVTLFQDGGFAPSRERVFNNPGVIATYKQKPEFLETLRTAIRQARSRPMERNYDHFSQELRTQLRTTSVFGDSVQLPPKSKLETTLGVALDG